MNGNIGGAVEPSGDSSMTTLAFSEQDLAQGVTRWMITNFGPQLGDAVKATPFSLPLLCAIACREAGAYWLPFTTHMSPAQILGLCVYDASGDFPGTSRTAFPTNRAQFQLAYGETFTNMLVQEANKARAARGLSPAQYLYKGYGIFQYDLQYVRSDQNFFQSKLWYNFTECVSRAVAELKKTYAETGDIQEAVRAYNGSGPNAEQYARDVMRLLTFCEAAAPPASAAAFGSPAGIAAQVPVTVPTDDDPAAPGAGEISNTADLATARVLTNLGAPSSAGILAEAELQALAPGQSPILSLDFGRAHAFLKACETSVPRVTYGLGKKVPFLTAVPGRNFTQVDCSGFVREVVRLSTNPATPFPDGSVVQHEWVQARGLAKSTVVEGMQNDGVMRIAFLRPQDVPSGIGHVVLIVNGQTLESHGGVGPDSRPWTGGSWQAKTFVYDLARDVQFTAVAPAASFQANQLLAAVFTVHHGMRYRATVTLSGIQQFATNGMVADELIKYGFINVVVTGGGATRVAEGLWTGPDTTAQIDSRLSNIVELPANAPAAVQGPVAEAVAARAIISSNEELRTRSPRSGKGLAMSNVFNTESMPTHHDDLLVVKMRDEALSSAPPLTTSAMFASSAPTMTTGLSALSFLERAGKIKRVIPLRRQTARELQIPGIGAASALTFSPAAAFGPQASPPERSVNDGVSFIELASGEDPQQLQTALAADPNVESVSKVPIRYLAARPHRKVAAAAAATVSGTTISAVPPNAPTMWNLLKISWEQARAQLGFRDANTIQVAVLDTGVDENHAELSGQVEEYHWQQPDLTRPISDRDIIGHGTHVCGTIAAIIGSAGVKGICKCRLKVWKIFDDEATYVPSLGAYVYYVNPVMYQRALADCVESPVDVMNLSIGGTAPPDDIEQSRFQQLLTSGVTICAAMGNDRQNNSPTSYPAAIPGVIAVGATGLDDTIAVFSNSGSHIALSAPGKAIWSTLPTYPGQTGFSAALGPDGQPRQGRPISRETNYDAWDGTSMATPHVTGCTALLLAKHNNGNGRLTPAQARNMLMQSADKVPAMSGAAFSNDYGAGRLDLFSLLQ